MLCHLLLYEAFQGSFFNQHIAITLFAILRWLGFMPETWCFPPWTENYDLDSFVSNMLLHCFYLGLTHLPVLYGSAVCFQQSEHQHFNVQVEDVKWFAVG